MIVQPCATENPQIPVNTIAVAKRILPRIVIGSDWCSLDALIREHQPGALGLGDPCPEHRHKCHADGLDLQAEIYQRMRPDKEGDSGRNARYHLILSPKS